MPTSAFALLTRALLVSALLAATASTAQSAPPPGSTCIEVDTSRDALSASARGEAVAALTLALRDRGIEVEAAPCEAPMRIWTSRHGAGYVVQVGWRQAVELGRAETVGALMQTYPEMLEALFPSLASEDEAPVASITTHRMAFRGAMGQIGGAHGTGKGFGFGYRYDGARFLIDLGMHGLFDVRGNQGAARVAVVLGASYVLLRDSPHAPYVGGGIGAGFTALDQDDRYGGGLEGVVTAGGIFFRHSWFPLFAQIDCHVPFYEIKGEALPVTVFGSLGIGLTLP